MHRGSGTIDVDPSTTDQPEALRYVDAVSVATPVIQNFTNNEVLASERGFHVVKNSPVQGHDLRSVIDGFTAWEVQSGVHAQYTAHYTFKDLDLVGAVQTGPGGRFGVEFGRNSLDMVVNGASIDGFEYGVGLEKSTTSNDKHAQGPTGYVLIDVDVKNSLISDYFKLNEGHQDLVLSGEQLVDGRLELIPTCPPSI